MSTENATRVSTSLLSRPTQREQSRWNKFLGQCGQCWSNCSGVTKQRAKDCWACCKLKFGAIRGCCVVCFWGIIGCCGLCSVLKVCCKPCLPLSKMWGLKKRALADQLDSMATLSVAGICTLNIFLATFFVSWLPKNIDCLPEIAVADPTKSEIEKWVKVIVVGLPFTMLPPTLYLAGQAKALQRDLKGLGFVAGCVLVEVIYMLCIGTMMMVCTSGSSFVLAAKIIGALIAFILAGCGCCCHYPKCLRSVLRCICCWGCTCEKVDDIEAPALPALPAPAAPATPPLAPDEQTMEDSDHAHQS